MHIHQCLLAGVKSRSMMNLGTVMLCWRQGITKKLTGQWGGSQSFTLHCFVWSFLQLWSMKLEHICLIWIQWLVCHFDRLQLLMRSIYLDWGGMLHWPHAWGHSCWLISTVKRYAFCNHNYPSEVEPEAIFIGHFLHRIATVWISTTKKYCLVCPSS